MAHRRLESDYQRAFIVDHKGKDLSAASPSSENRDRAPTVEDIAFAASDPYSSTIAEAAMGRLWNLLDQDGDGRLNLDEARYFVAMIDTIGSSVPGRHPSEI